MLSVTFVRDHIPLEQGLRPEEGLPRNPWCLVRDHIPLEQGLRPLRTEPAGDLLRQRPYSIRTRIKTCRS